MSDDMGDHSVMIPLPPGPRARGRSPLATTIVTERPLGSDHGKNLKYDDKLKSEETET